VLALILSPVPGAAAAPSPTEQVRGAIDRVIQTLKRPDLKDKAKRDARRKILREEIQPVFDFGEMARRSLGIHWRERTPEEKAQFVKLFTELLENSYLGKIESYQGERIRYLGERVDPPRAEVHTMIETTRQQEIPVDYRMLLEGDQWKIYDVVVEGISLVNNYRSQFGSVLERSSFSQLLGKLRATVKESSGT